MSYMPMACRQLFSRLSFETYDFDTNIHFKHDFVDENIGEYVPLYQKVLNEYNMEITFI